LPLEQLLQRQGVLVITGATGWVGRTAVAELQRLLPPPLFAERVRLFASRAGSLAMAGGAHPLYPLQALPELAAAEPLAAVLHTAFLTRDRLETVGLETYVATNRSITQQVARALALAPTARAVVISSGAAAAIAAADPDQLACDPYGVLKREEERLLAGLVPSLVLRIYALTGRFIRDPRRFALGDFLLTALRGEPIRIQAPMPVWRSYGHAGDITALAWRWLLAPAATDDALSADPLAAVSLGLDLRSLAQRITELYQLPPLQASMDPLAPPNRYLADPAPFLAALERHGLAPTSLEQQLRDTAAGLQELSGGTLGR
jgi:nucleoside-diphosphate-sugar epimerase